MIQNSNTFPIKFMFMVIRVNIMLLHYLSIDTCTNRITTFAFDILTHLVGSHLKLLHSSGLTIQMINVQWSKTLDSCGVVRACDFQSVSLKFGPPYNYFDLGSQVISLLYTCKQYAVQNLLLKTSFIFHC